MTDIIALTDSERAQVAAILGSLLPAGTRVGLFGSRACGKAKPWSDLDLVLESAEPLPLATLAALTEAFDEAALPWKVDLVDRRMVSAAFGAIIDAGRVDFPEG